MKHLSLSLPFFDLPQLAQKGQLGLPETLKRGNFFVIHANDHTQLQFGISYCNYLLTWSFQAISISVIILIAIWKSIASIALYIEV